MSDTNAAIQSTGEYQINIFYLKGEHRAEYASFERKNEGKLAS